MIFAILLYFNDIFDKSVKWKLECGKSYEIDPLNINEKILISDNSKSKNNSTVSPGKKILHKSFRRNALSHLSDSGIKSLNFYARGKFKMGHP